MQTFDSRPQSQHEASEITADVSVLKQAAPTAMLAAQTEIAGLATGAAWLRLITLIQARPLGGSLTPGCWQRWAQASALLDELLDGNLERAQRAADCVDSLLGSNPLLRSEVPLELLERACNHATARPSEATT
jgi:hypothetical protein